MSGKEMKRYRSEVPASGPVTGKVAWDPAVDGIVELAEHRRMVKDLRALAMGWEKEADELDEDATRRHEANPDAVLLAKRLATTRMFRKRAAAIFAIVGRE